MSAPRTAMMGMLFIMADVMSVDDIIKDVKQEIANYEEAKLLNKPIEELEKLQAFIGFYMMMFIHKISKSNAIQTMEGIEKMEKLRNLHNPPQG